MSGLDPIALQVWGAALRAVADEMQAALVRSSFSVTIKERRDCSTALFDGRGRMVAQSDSIPVHLGAMPEAVEAVMAAGAAPGEAWIVNDPFTGGTHLPDLTIVTPIAIGGEVVAHAVTRAHHADVGGMTPGSMPAGARDLLQEGLVLPPVRLAGADGPDHGVMAIIAANSRTPDERRGDIAAQLAAHALAQRRLDDLCARRGGPRALAGAMDSLLAYAERRTRAAIAAMPDGEWTAAEALEGDGVTDDDIVIRVRVAVRGDSMEVDFTGTDPAGPGNLNCPIAVTRSSVFFAVRVATDPDIPASAGAYAPVTITAPQGSLVNAPPGSAVAAGNVESSSRIADAVLAALSGAADVPAQGQGTMNNLTLGFEDRVYFETLGGGQGASSGTDGPSAVHVAMSNTLNTPVEALELAMPVRVERYAVRRGSGGEGAHRGGDGVVRRIRLLEPAEASLIAERRRSAPAGAEGGGDGLPGETLIDDVPVPGKWRGHLPAGAVIEQRTPGGGGHGPAAEEALHAGR
ncbi:MAG: hydantoinase B/oxoprolinase family protein [Acidobacteria bacterium]|nr:hydantoinase B/oxoprolinase family protein [Acidobacteriota bacterium]